MMQQTSIPSPPPDPDDVDIIAYQRTQLAATDDMYTIAKSTLNTCLSTADYGAAGERITYGNPAGLTLLEESNDMKQSMKRLQDKLDKVEQKQDANQLKQEADIKDLQHHVKTLTQASKGYPKIRHRFLEVYHRDVLQDIDRQGRQKISEGNEVTHGGDAATDAALYTAGERSDEQVLANLYGLNATQISLLVQADDYASISILNAGATWKATRPGNIPQDVAAAFETFVSELTLNFGKSPTDGTTSLGKAYYAFWRVHKMHW